jgi:hypothetical protein
VKSATAAPTLKCAAGPFGLPLAYPPAGVSGLRAGGPWQPQSLAGVDVEPVPEQVDPDRDARAAGEGAAQGRATEARQAQRDVRAAPA